MPHRRRRHRRRKLQEEEKNASAVRRLPSQRSLRLQFHRRHLCHLRATNRLLPSHGQCTRQGKVEKKRKKWRRQSTSICRRERIEKKTLTCTFAIKKNTWTGLPRPNSTVTGAIGPEAWTSPQRARRFEQVRSFETISRLGRRRR